ncbi:MAG: hypothetical protein QY325_04260 [Flavobacteriales bacterium]|nr:MAG: hypothetical protein QY325_04260 [Flavobacteriales bacterium]
MVQINGPVPAGTQEALQQQVDAYAKANPSISMAGNLEFTVQGADGPVTVKGALQRIGAQLIFMVAREAVRFVADRLSRRQKVKQGKSKRMPPQMGGGGMPAAAPAEQSPEQAFADLLKMGMIRTAGKGWEMAGKPPLKFESKEALLDHLAGKAPRKEVRAAKKAARKAQKAVKKEAKAATKAAKKSGSKR